MTYLEHHIGRIPSWRNHSFPGGFPLGELIVFQKASPLGELIVLWEDSSSENS
jgi:hypothetical protein